MTGNMLWAARTRAASLAPPTAVHQLRRDFGAQSAGNAGHRMDRLTTRSRGQSQRRRPLPERFRTALEHMSGMPMGDVQVHYGSSQPDDVEAHAYTQGNQIHLAPGQEHHLAHEAWHVVQQKQRRVRPTIQVASRPVNDSDGLEREADRMAVRIRAFSAPSAGPSVQQPGTNAATVPVMQRVDKKIKKRKHTPKPRLTRGRARKNLDVSADLRRELIQSGKRQRKGVARYGIGDGTRTGIGPYAVGSISTANVNRNFTPGERLAIRRLGKTHGCHQCGSKNEAHYVPDHQPPLSTVNLATYRGRLYPHCKKCSSLQGGLLSKGKK